MATQERPFPYVLVGMTALMGFAAIRADTGWIQISSAIGTVFLAACALYQARPEPKPEDELDDEIDNGVDEP